MFPDSAIPDKKIKQDTRSSMEFTHHLSKS